MPLGYKLGSKFNEKAIGNIFLKRFQHFSNILNMSSTKNEKLRKLLSIFKKDYKQQRLIAANEEVLINTDKSMILHRLLGIQGE